MIIRGSNALLDALREERFANRRQQLRALAKPALESKLNSGLVRKWFANSPLVGTDPHQINPRATVTGLRDCLDEDTLIALASPTYDTGDLIEGIKNAIISPIMHGTPSSASSTGYTFGRPKTLAHGLRDRFPDPAVLLPTITTTEGSTMTDTGKPPFAGGLEAFTRIYDCCQREGFETTDIIEAMRVVLDPTDAMIEGLNALLEVRKVAPEAAPLTPAMQTAFDDVMSYLNGDDEDEAPTPDKSLYNPPADAQLIDLALSQAGLPPIGKLIGELNDATAKAKVAAVQAAIPQVVEASAGGATPKGRVVTIKASKAFGIKGAAAKSFDFDVPMWEWDAPHPNVPPIDKDYVFRGTSLLRILYALLTNKRMYLHGHSGSGKTTYIEQVAARLYWPFLRVNFDGDIGRLDLIGRDTLVQEGGTTVSQFIEGILPQMLSGPYIGCFDEIDAVKPEISFVMQRVFEGNGLMLTEDGGRYVTPNRMFRMFATGNTVGQGDEFGMYQGVRPQSIAMLDRFTVWAHIDYLSETERSKLISKRVPTLSKDMATKVNKYTSEHIEAFKTSKVMQPISPRGFINMAEAIVMFEQVFPASKQKDAVNEAVAMTVLDRATVQDRVVLSGIVNRVFA